MNKPLKSESGRPLKIAVIGSGAAGLTAAWLLDRKHEVTLYEAAPRLGGHTCTLTVPHGPDAGMPVDAGFIVMNHRNYPILTRMFERLKVELDDSDMSFSFRDLTTGYAYSGTSVRSLFAQPANLVRPGHWRMVTDILRFNREAEADLAAGRLKDRSLLDYLEQSNFSVDFRERYLLAMGSAIWSSPTRAMESFPAEAFVRFFSNHGLLTLRDRPQWRYVKGGSCTYIQRMMEEYSGVVHKGHAVRQLQRDDAGVTVHAGSGDGDRFDAAVVAAHADQALQILDQPTEAESKLLGAWQYRNNTAVLHTDPSVMPKEKSAWASWNFIRNRTDPENAPVSVTYHMNRLQKLPTLTDYFVSLNHPAGIDPGRVCHTLSFAHPQFSFEAIRSQDDLPSLNGVNRTWFCGSYFGYGFHEDAVRSGVEVARQLGVEL